MALSDNSKDRIKFACKELEEALSSFEMESAISVTNAEAAGAPATNIPPQEKITEIKRQLQHIREQLDQLSQ